MTNVAPLKVLLVDNAPDRKERIALLRNHGLTVYPALDIAQARQRCKTGRFALIIVNAAVAPELALEVCDQIRSENPEQPLIMMIEPGVSAPARDYVEPIEPEALLKRVKAIFTAAQAGKALAA